MPLRPETPDPKVLAWLEDPARFRELAARSRETMHVQDMIRVKIDGVCSQGSCRHYAFPSQVYSLPWTERDERDWLETGDVSPLGTTEDEISAYYQRLDEWSREREHRNDTDWENW